MQMYSLLLEVQDFEKKFLQTPEHQRDALLEQHKTHTLQLYNSLREKEWDDRWVPQKGLYTLAWFNKSKPSPGSSDSNSGLFWQFLNEQKVKHEAMST